ncbi:MAG: sugar ABC transporter permease [Bacillota bacterium]|nr:sugar ABC transporter permease [Bacillota bacterium]
MKERRIKARNRYRWDEIRTAIICLAPAAAIFAVFNVVPTVWSLVLSLSDWDWLGTARRFVGLAQYGALLRSPEFWNSLRVTVLYTTGVTVLGLVAGLTVALCLSGNVRARAFWRSVYFTPAVTATVAAGVVWVYLFDPAGGLVNLWLRRMGLPGPAWLTDPSWALVAIIMVSVWKRLGLNTVIYLAGLQSIPDEYYEAVSVDGGGVWAGFAHVTWPLLAPTTWLLAIMSVIDSFQVFDLVYVMTSGGPMGATEVMGLYLYRQAFRLFHMGYASAVGWTIFIFVFLATLLQWRVSGAGGASIYGASTR